jgi:hypothetical protein
MTQAISKLRPRSIGSPVTIFDSASTSSVANGSAAITASAISWSTNLDEFLRFTLEITGFGTTPSALQPIYLYEVLAGGGSGGTTYEDGSSTVFPPIPIWTFSTRAASTLVQNTRRIIAPERDAFYILQNASGQSMNSGWAVRATPCTREANW